MEKPENTAQPPAPTPCDGQPDFGLRFNGRLSYVCRLIATAVLGRLDYGFAFIGLATAVALLALAGLQEHHDEQQRR